MEKPEISNYIKKDPSELTTGEILIGYQKYAKALEKYIEEQLRIHDVVGRSEQLVAYTEWLKKEGLLNATVSKLIVKKYQSEQLRTTKKQFHISIKQKENDNSNFV